MITKEMAEAAASWWAGRVDGWTRHDNGDVSQASQTAMMLADLMQRPVVKANCDRFKERLAQKIIESDITYLGCDYDPCKTLYDAAGETGIPIANFPFKVSMWLEDGKVIVSNGYGIRPEVIFPTQTEED